MISTLSIHLKSEKKDRGEFLTPEMFKNKTNVSTQRGRLQKLGNHSVEALSPVMWEKGPVALHDGKEYVFPSCALETERRGSSKAREASWRR